MTVLFSPRSGARQIFVPEMELTTVFAPEMGSTTVFVPEGRLIVAQQFIAGTVSIAILCNKSRRDGRKGASRIRSSLRDEDGI